MHQDSIADPYGCQVSASYSFACKGVIFPAKCKEKREEGHLLPGGPDFHITSPASMSLKMSLDLNESFLPFFFSSHSPQFEIHDFRLNLSLVTVLVKVRGYSILDT